MNPTTKAFLALLAVLCLLSSCNPEEKEQSSINREMAFNDNWQFHQGDSIQTSAENWREVKIPHDWSIEGDFRKDHPAGFSGGALPGGLGWYQKTFKIDAKDSTFQHSIRFDGVYQDSEVWVNGNYLGKRSNGYIGFEYDLNPYLNFGDEPNEILVKVDNSRQPNSRWYSGSGIYRNVWLLKTDKLHVAPWGTFVTTPNITEEKVEVSIETTVENEYAETKSGRLETLIYDGKTEIAQTSEEINVEAGNTKKFLQNISLSNPELWSIENPKLYKTVTRIILNDEIVDEYKTPFGIREFEFDTKKGFLLNGEQTKIKGVCLHHDLGPLGAAISTRAIERQLEIMKEMGVNAIRTAHNPPAPEFLELCDKMGFIVMNEAYDMWEKPKTEFDYAKDWDKWHKKDLEDLVLRDRNHPSVFMWSIGNEIPEQWEERGAEIGRKLSKIVKDLDSTRPVTAGMNPPIHTSEEDVTLQFEESAKPNALAGSGALDIIGYNYAHQTYEHHRKNFPDIPFIATETNSALATRGYYEFPSDTTKIWPVRWDLEFTGGNDDNTVSAFDQVRSPWGSLHETTWKIIKKHDFLSGMFIWTGFDYLGEPTPYTWPSRSSYFGVVDLAGFPKDTYYMYKSEWTDEPVLHVFPHWNWEEGQSVDVWAYYNNADEVELFLNGESLGTKKKEGDDLHVMWRLPFEPGMLKAISRKDGKTVLEKTIKTAGEPAKLTLEADRESIKADGNDLSFVTVAIYDEEGNLAPRAGNKIHFSLEGNGEIVGVASGDPTNHESFKGTSHTALNGKCLVIVQAGKNPENLELTAKSEGLKAATISIKTN